MRASGREPTRPQEVVLARPRAVQSVVMVPVEIRRRDGEARAETACDPLEECKPPFPIVLTDGSLQNRPAARHPYFAVRSGVAEYGQARGPMALQFRYPGSADHGRTETHGYAQRCEASDFARAIRSAGVEERSRPVALDYARLLPQLQRHLSTGAHAASC